MSNLNNDFSVESKLGASELKDYPTRIQMATLELAALYHEHGLITKSIETLECLINSIIQPNPVIYLALGDLYVHEGTDIPAKERYTKAVELALATGDHQVVVAAKAGLANIEAIFGEMSEANRLHQEAKAEFEVLGDIHQWDKLKERLDSLNSKEQKLPVLMMGLKCGDCNVSASQIGRRIYSGVQWDCTPC